MRQKKENANEIDKIETADITAKQETKAVETENADIGIPEEQPSELEQFQEQYNALNDRYLRTVAEYDNYRKRTDREKLASASNGCCNAIEQILPVLDTLETAAAAPTEDAEYKKGVQMTLDLFKNALTALGIEEIEAENKPFDPELHYAVSREQKEGVESGNITMVLQKGYKMGGRIIRYAVVMVAE